MGFRREAGFRNFPKGLKKVLQENVKLLTNLTFCFSFTRSPTGTLPLDPTCSPTPSGSVPVGDVVKLRQNVKLVSNFTFSCTTFSDLIGIGKAGTVFL